MLGVDGSAEMIEGVRELGLPAEVMDGQNLVFEHEFDAVFSNAALHWDETARCCPLRGMAGLEAGGAASWRSSVRATI